mmetsp:Transcript_21754/g.49474  ORF Transcript_21754/g.49474 Transcript_21754/m.49474 type:complete len:221 (-) Transcript_21754:177-839(-)
MSVDGGRHRSAGEDLGLDLGDVGSYLPVLGNGGVGIKVDLYAFLAECFAGPADVFLSAGRVDVRAESLVRIAGTPEVGAARIIGDVPGVILDEVEGTAGKTSVARPRHALPAVQNVLDRQVNLGLGPGLLRDLDTVAQDGESGVGPAAPAVLGEVLVQTLGHVADPINIAPVEGGGELIGADVGVREGGGVVLQFGVARHLLAKGARPREVVRSDRRARQ